MLLLTCFFIQECMRLEYTEEQIAAVNMFILVAIFTMIALNIGYLIYTAIVKCKEKSHLKSTKMSTMTHLMKIGTNLDMKTWTSQTTRKSSRSTW